jgi:dihydroflavonol-4-reductase
MSTLPSASEQLVCVTGANGYVASHVVRELLARGHRVRGTVRNPDDPAKTHHLKSLRGADERLELMQAELGDPEGFHRALQGCTALLHTASPARFAAKDPQREIVDPAINGTRHVLAAAADAGSVERVVLTSSVAAIMRYDRAPDYEFTEDDWCEDATVESNPYGLAKTSAERAAWDFHASLPAASRFSLVTINPSVVFGPVLARAHLKTSPNIVFDMLTGTFPGCPRMIFNVVDVREVAQAHVTALENASLEGRFIVSQSMQSWQQLAQLLASEYPQRRIKTRQLPNWLLYGAALFDERVSFPFLRNNLGRGFILRSDRAEKELRISYRSIAETLRDTTESLIALGLLD